MVDLNLEQNERIILQARDVTCHGEEELTLSELILTNMNIIYVIERKKLLKKYFEVQKYGFDSLVIKDGHIDATIASFKGFDACLKLQFKSGKEYIVFNSPSRKLITSWIFELNKAALGVLVEIGDTKKRSFGSKLAKGLKIGVMGTLGIERDEKISVVGNKQKDNIPTVFQSNFEDNPLSRNQTVYVSNNNKNIHSEMINQFCHNCGLKLHPEAKFCPKCGTPVLNNSNATYSTNPANQTSVANASYNYVSQDSNTRKVEYVGKVLKCPNCGCVIGNNTMLCPDCGMKINREVAYGSIQTFYDRLMEIESKRKPKKNSMFVQIDPVDEQKLAFIRSYPIPNSIEDIVEFFTLAANNINVLISKNSFWNKIDDPSIEKQISDAWVVKMQNLYKKAKRLFPNDEAFLQMQDIYFSKMKELNIKY